MTQKKILVIVLNPFTHDNRVLRQSETLANAGARVTVYALHEGKLPREDRLRELAIRRFEISSRPLPKARPVQLIKYAECVLRMVAAGVRLRPAAIHANDVNALPIGYLIAKLTGAKLVYDSHELWSGAAHKAVFPAWIYNMGIAAERALARRADAVISASPSYSQQMAKQMDIPTPTTIRNLPVRRQWNDSGGLPAGPRNPLHSALGLDPAVPLIIHVGQAGRGRGLETFIRGMGMVNEPAVAVFLGGGSKAYLESLAKLASDLGLSKRVFFHPPVPFVQLFRYASEAAIGAALIEDSCPSYYYTLPNKIFEYIQSDLPVVASGIPELARIVNEYQVGEVFRIGDAEHFSEVVNRFLADPELMAAYRENTKRAAQELTWDREEPKLLHIYNTLLGSDSGRESRLAAAGAQ